MSWSTILRNIDWDFRSSFEEVNTMPFMSSVWPIATTTAAYLLFVLKIGPMVMETRKPFNLKYYLLAYNLFQVCLSMYMVIKAGCYIRDYGLIQIKCFADHEEMRKETLHLVWIYMTAKVTELLDTVFFVLRKKFSQVTFLHVYHHTIMALMTWMFLKYFPNSNVIFAGGLNAVVHVFMYTYYGLSTLPGLTKYLWWKQYITTLQLVQFLVVAVYYHVSVYSSACPPSVATIAYVTLNIFFFVYMFAKFYIDNYSKNKRLKSVNGAPSSESPCVNGNKKVTKKLKAN